MLPKFWRFDHADKSLEPPVSLLIDVDLAPHITSTQAPTSTFCLCVSNFGLPLFIGSEKAALPVASVLAL